jgi:hypothetical protein
MLKMMMILLCSGTASTDISKGMLGANEDQYSSQRKAETMIAVHLDDNPIMLYEGTIIPLEQMSDNEFKFEHSNIRNGVVHKWSGTYSVRENGGGLTLNNSMTANEGSITTNYGMLCIDPEQVHK